MTIDENGTPIRDLDNGDRLWLYRMMFTWRIAIGPQQDHWGYRDMWCFHDEAEARREFEHWNPLDPATPEPSGWHRHPPTGRRRKNGDPATEYVAP